MAEKRKPSMVMLLQKQGKKTTKKNKIELFDSELWSDGKRWMFGSRAKRYRLRINGRWNDKIKEGNKKYFTSWEFRDLLWRTMKL